MASSDTTPRALGTFAGVFTPTLLTILGVILYLRLGWVVGQAGLLGAWAVIGLSVAITLATALSLSSIATNTRLSAGGAYGIVTRSLGLEVGGSVGLPLYLSQALVVAMYVFGFREGWLWLFPEHPALVVDLVVFAVVFGLAWVSASVAFKVQYAVMVVIGLSLVSVAFGGWGAPLREPVFVSEVAEVGFWGVFAVFFPAATGVLAGANMSGELAEPRRSIPRGTLAALGLSSVVYFGLAAWAAVRIAPTELVTNTTAMIDHAAVRPLVLAGLLGATFSSAVTSMVGAPRILQAMGRNRVLPGSKWLARASADGEPRNALLFTGGVALFGLFARELNVIAPLITLFFLLAYLLVNLVVLIEGQLGLTSFRPTFRVPTSVAVFGVVGCFVAMVVVQPMLSLVAGAVVIALHTALVRRKLAGDREDVRSSLFVSLAEWAARQVVRLGGDHPRSWRPNLLVPVDAPQRTAAELPLLLDLTRPEGSLQLLGVAPSDSTELDLQLAPLRHQALDAGVFSNASSVETPDFGQGVGASLQALQGAFFHPNVLFVSMSALPDHYDDLPALVEACRRHRLGALVLAGPPPDPTGRVPVVRVLVRPQDDADPMTDGFSLGNLNLTLLVAWRLARAWSAEVELLCALSPDGDPRQTRAYLDQLVVEARLSPNTKRVVGDGPLMPVLASRPTATLTLSGLSQGPFSPDTARTLVDRGRCPFLFVLDSGQESARV